MAKYDDSEVAPANFLPPADEVMKSTARVSKARTFSNVIYNTLSRGIVISCQLLASIVIARNLSPADMGVVGFATVIISFLSQFSDCGLESAAIRRAQLTALGMETAFVLKLVLGALACGAALLIAPFAHHFCEHPAVADVVRVLALNFLVSSIGFLPTVWLARDMNYRAQMIPNAVNALTRCGLAVALVLCGWKFWAVVLAEVGACLAANLAFLAVRKVHWGLRFDRAEAKEFLQFGLPLLGAGLLTFAIFSMDNFLVSTTMGIAALGYYALAFNWGSFICSFLANTVNGVLFPTFAAIQDDLEKMRRWYLKTVDLVAFIALAANTMLLANARSFLVVFMGKGTDKWIPALAALQILCLYGILRATIEPVGNCLMVRGRTKTLLQANILCGLIQLVLLALVLPAKKIEWVAAVVFAAYACQAIIYLPFLRREMAVTAVDLIRQLWPMPPALAGGWWLTQKVFPATAETLLALALRGLFTFAVVSVIHGSLTRFRCFYEARDLVWKKFSGKFAGAQNPGSHT
jgi:lipopolysaccharide exporter